MNFFSTFFDLYKVQSVLRSLKKDVDVSSIKMEKVSKKARPTAVKTDGWAYLPLTRCFCNETIYFCLLFSLFYILLFST